MLGILPQAQIAKVAAEKGAEKYKSLDKNQKMAVNIGGIALGIGVLFIGYKVMSNMNGMFDTLTGKKAEEERRAAEDKVKSQFDKDLNKGVPTLSEVQAKGIAQSLLDAFEYPGTYDEQAKSNLRALKNQFDWILVSKQYGMPRGRTLRAELYNEFGNSGMKEVRAILSKINVMV
ncbi:MAG: hypothetical protein JEZ01_11490 [Labilibaculum sp.]|nr:hypothetical protein [Labilibaculum sp.]MBI9058375.1 hypothetical protein [Labilibaculum sp.]